jgi:4-amino-4-deoxy-L-arabinose transferase-like glycosyltransferase
MALGLALRLGYVLITHGHTLIGDEIEYHDQGRLAADGHWFWSTKPFGIAHPSLVKAPGYSAWVGVWYSLFGVHPDRVMALQALLGPVTIALSWLLARRLFGARAALVAAALVAVYPMAWQFEARLYSESLATPLTLLALLLVLERDPTPRRAALTGLALGLSLLVRPSAIFLFAGIAVAWWLAAGLRRGTAMLALASAVTVLAVLPWTVRNYHYFGAIVPLSITQDAALYGTFNRDAAEDPVYPYAWRPAPASGELADYRGPPIDDAELGRRLRRSAWHWIEDHPDAVPKAFFWNGLSRLWDVRRPARVVNEVRFEGRTRGVTIAGLVMYWVLLPLALVSLWLLRRRRLLVWPVVALALGASVAFTADSGTRYRATLEPLIVVLATGAAFELPARARRRALSGELAKQAV